MSSMTVRVMGLTTGEHEACKAAGCGDFSAVLPPPFSAKDSRRFSEILTSSNVKYD